MSWPWYFWPSTAGILVLVPMASPCAVRCVDFGGRNVWSNWNGRCMLCEVVRSGWSCAKMEKGRREKLFLLWSLIIRKFKGIKGFGRYMDVSKNSGTPKSSILIGFSIINHPFWGTTIFGNTHICEARLGAAGFICFFFNFHSFGGRFVTVLTCAYFFQLGVGAQPPPRKSWSRL